MSGAKTLETIVLVGLLLRPIPGWAADPQAILEFNGVESLVTTCRGAEAPCEPITLGEGSEIAWETRATTGTRPGWVSYWPVGDRAICEHFRAVLARRGIASRPCTGPIHFSRGPGAPGNRIAPH
ncbi:MAG TPA: hypothetical protein VJN62_09335 [Gemmatimonadales bacterium]|nr:hypothetical protein [Gemmatimonadales bacterium]